MNTTCQKKIFLVGPMGAGKSSIGKQLAKTLRFTFYDLDHAIETQTGVNIPWIFDVEGEAGFRKRETTTLVTLAQQENIVLATGGGAIGREENRACMKANGCVIYLFATVDQQYERVYRDTNRPLLQSESPKETLHLLFEKRDPLYRSIASMVVDTNGKSVLRVVREIQDVL